MTLVVVPCREILILNKITHQITKEIISFKKGLELVPRSLSLSEILRHVKIDRTKDLRMAYILHPYISNCCSCANKYFFPPIIYLFKANNENIRKMFEICSKLTIKTPERRQCQSGNFSVNSELIPRITLVFSLLTLNK